MNTNSLHEVSLDISNCAVGGSEMAPRAAVLRCEDFPYISLADLLLTLQSDSSRDLRR